MYTGKGAARQRRGEGTHRPDSEQEVKMMETKLTLITRKELSEGAAVKSRMRENFKSGSVRGWETRKVWGT
jgi:hypothetical protein